MSLTDAIMQEELEPVTVLVTNYPQAITLRSRLESKGIPIPLSYQRRVTVKMISFEGFALIGLKFF